LPKPRTGPRDKLG